VPFFFRLLAFSIATPAAHTAHPIEVVILKVWNAGICNIED